MPGRPLILMLVGVMLLAARKSQGAGEEFFRSKVAPALETKCVACHRPGNLKGELDLTTREGMLKGGEDGPALAAGDVDNSALYSNAISQGGRKPRMPRKGEALTAEEAAALRQWIADGAAWPRGLVLREKAKADGSFWSFAPVATVEPPVVDDAPPAWRKHPIDRFIFAKLKEKGLKPSEPASARELIRRMTYDLTGLPPTPDEVAAFTVDYGKDAESAVDKLVDRLLASPRYGEQWGRHWLDVIRFGESRGYERNQIITNLWPFRDYIIKSFNDDKPFDQLVREHLAGDVIGKDRPEVEIGSAFLVAGPYDDVGNQDAVAAAQIRADQMDEMIRATGEAFLGLTIGCARCHDHKFDPLLAKDYYALYATFAGTRHGECEVASSEARQAVAPLIEQRGKLIPQRDALKKKGKEGAEELKRIEGEIKRLDGQIAKAPGLNKWWVGTHAAAPGPFHVFVGGNPQRKGDAVTPASLAVLAGRPSSYRLDDKSSEAQRRTALAEWIVSSDNPLTARVLANRLWHYHFATGIVDTPSDFGYMGSRPTHPELLDWLAKQVQTNGWKIKPLHRLIMTSQAYRQSAAWNEQAARLDADSRYLWRFPPRRLSAEEVRDTMLTISGKLDLKMGGEGFRLYEYQQDNVATYVPLDSHGPQTYRRAVYHHNARAMRVDLISDFDCPDPALAEPRRSSTTTPLQALTLMNHRFSLDMAAALAARLTAEASAADEQVKRCFAIAYGRDPSSEELSAGEALVKSHGLRALCRAILNSSELIHLN